MTDAPAQFWPWIAIAGLGVFHGVNPAMGWLFAVALGLHRRSAGVVALSLAPIALGHLAAVAAVVAGFVTLGLVVDRAILMRLAGCALIGWAAWHGLRGHRGRPFVGLQTGLLGLVGWSFVMASAHGAGLMLFPALLPLCAGASPAAPWTAAAFWPALAALGVHTAAMLFTIAAISLAVYGFVDIGVLRRGWINLDLVWTGALVACGILLLVQASTGGM
jgi:hypothetical protein